MVTRRGSKGAIGSFISVTTNQPLIVFVQLGVNPSPILLHSAELAIAQMEIATGVLITNNPSEWSGFPGLVIKYDIKKHRHASIKRLIKRFPEREEISGSYWIYTLERLFALKILCDFFPQSTPMLHIESDNYSLIDRLIFDEMVTRCSKVSVPRFSEIQGIASVLFAPTLRVLDETINEFGDYIDGSKSWLGDMNLLGLALNDGVVQELPTKLEHSWEIGSPQQNENIHRLIFDGLAIGQYLHGQDPYHTNGYAIPKHINEYFDESIASWKWFIANTDRSRVSQLRFESNSEVFRVANIHVHSKLMLPTLDSSNEIWRETIDIANGLKPPVATKQPKYDIHSEDISLLNKFRFARRNGWRHVVRESIKRVMRMFTKQKS
jgi:hypothetical protein